MDTAVHETEATKRIGYICIQPTAFYLRRMQYDRNEFNSFITLPKMQYLTY